MNASKIWKGVFSSLQKTAVGDGMQPSRPPKYSQGTHAYALRIPLFFETTDDSIYAFMMAQHERLGQFSTAQALPECCCVHIAEFAESANERVEKARAQDEEELAAKAIIRLISRT